MAGRSGRDVDAGEVQAHEQRLGVHSLELQVRRARHMGRAGRQGGAHPRQRAGALQYARPEALEPPGLRLLVAHRQLGGQRQGPGRHHVLRPRAQSALLAPAPGRRHQRQVAPRDEGPDAHGRPDLVTGDRHGVQPPGAQAHRHPAQRRHGVGVHRHVARLAGSADPGGLPHDLHESADVLHGAGLVVGRHDAHQRGSPPRDGLAQALRIDQSGVVDLDLDVLGPQVRLRGARRVQDRGVLDGGGDDRGSPHAVGPRRQDPAGDDQCVGLRAPTGEDHLVRVGVQHCGQAGARLGQQRPDAPPRGVLSGRVRPPGRPVAQVRGHLLGHLRAHGGGCGVVEIGAGRC